MATNYPTFDELQKRCSDDNIDIYEKIGFNSKLRSIEIEKLIFEDIITKLNISNKNNLKILDLGCGCSNLVNNLINFCKSKNNELHLIDGENTINLIKDSYPIKHKGLFPNDFSSFLKEFENKFDVIIMYSVIHHFYENNTININLCLNKILKLLKSNGKLIIGDIPNTCKQNKFNNSSKGIELHNKWNIKPKNHLSIEESRIDNSFILNIITRYRNYNYNTYLLPQPENFPMNYVRDDILIVKI